MVVGNTLFENHKKRRYTWLSRINENEFQVDYTNTAKIKNLFKKCKAFLKIHR